MNTNQKARFAVSAYFLIGGTAVSLWAVHIPSVEKNLDLTHAAIGSILLFLGAGAFVAMNAIGLLVDRVGSRTGTVIGGTLTGLALILPAIATEPITLGLAVFILGLGIGSVDVAMNAHSIEVERAYGRPILSGMHALWSAGGIAGSAIGWYTLGQGIEMLTTLVIAGLAMAALSIALRTWLLPNSPSDLQHKEQQSRSGKKANRKTAAIANRRVLPYVILLGAMAAFSAIGEGSAGDWSALHLTGVLGSSAQVGALGLLVFSLAMTIFRLMTDAIVAKLGRIFVIRWGSLIGAFGIAIVAYSTEPWVALVGWGVTGIGLSGVIPQIFAAAGNLGEPTHTGRNMAKVVGVTYVGVLAGPAIIGWLTFLMPLNLSIGCAAILSLLVFIASRFVKVDR